MIVDKAFNRCLIFAVMMSLNVALMAQTDSLVTGQKPEPLPVTPITEEITRPGLTRWFGSPDSQFSKVSGVRGVAGGKKYYVTPENNGDGMYICQPDEQSGDMKITGIIPVVWNSAASLDGRWFMGSKLTEDKIINVYQADTYEGVWQIKLNNNSHVLQRGFTRNGNHLVIVVNDKAKGQIDFNVFESATGKQVFRYQKYESDEDKANNYRFTSTNEAILLSPACHESTCITRIELDTWKQTFVSEPFKEALSWSMETDSSGRYLLMWNRYYYVLLEKTSANKYVRTLSGGSGAHPTMQGYLADAFGSIRISPDSKTLVISGGCMHKVIRISDRKVIHESSTECRCGVFSPDSKTFWHTCQPLRRVDTQTWEFANKDEFRQSGEVEQMTFSPNGRLLGTRASDTILVWEVGNPSQAPRARLKSSRGGMLSEFGWSKDGTEIFGGDKVDFLRWKLAGNFKNDAPVDLVSSLLFETYFSNLPERKESDFRAEDQYLAVDHATGACLLSMNNHPGHNELRHESRPDVIKKPKIDRIEAYPVKDVFFSNTGDEVYYFAEHWEVSDELFSYNFSTQIQKRAVFGRSSEILNYDPTISQLIILDDRKPAHIKWLDTATLEVVREVPISEITQKRSFTSLVVSKNGKWAFGSASESKTGQIFLFLVDLEKQEVKAKIPAPFGYMTKMVFSPDCKSVSIGFTNGTTALWDVEELAKSTPALSNALPIPVTPEAPSGNASPPKKNPFIWPAKAFPQEPIPVKGGATMIVPPDASVQVRATGLDVGRILIDGQSLTGKGLRVRTRKDGTFSAYSGQTELRATNLPLRIHRDFYLSSSVKGYWKDIIQNVGDEEVEFDLVFVSSLAVPIDTLTGDQDSKPRIEDHILLPDEKTDVLASLSKMGEINRFTAFTFRSVDAPRNPVLNIQKDGKTIHSEWRIRLKPLERCCIINKVQSSPAADTDTLATLVPERRWDRMKVGGCSLLLPYCLNVGLAPEPENIITVTRHFDRGPDVQEDSLGFLWRSMPFTQDGMHSKLVGDMLALWLDHEPATFSIPVDRGDQELERSYQCESLSGDSLVLRRQYFSPEEGAYTTCDTVKNPTDVLLTTTVDILVMSNDGVRGIMNTAGEIQEATPIFDTAKIGRTFAILSKGQNQEATIVSTGQDSSKVRPTVHFERGRGVFIRYQLNLAPGEEVSLTHIALPRPLDAYAEPKDAFAELRTDEILKPLRTVVLKPFTNWSP